MDAQGAVPGAAGREPSGDDAPASVIGRVRLILEAFGPDEASLSLSEISRRSGIPKASVHRLSRELLAWGVLERSGPEFSLGMRLYELGSRVPLVRELRDNVRPFMADLQARVGETVNLGIMSGDDVLFVERASRFRQYPRQARLGGRIPLHCSSTGRVLMAFGPDTLLEQVMTRPMPRLTRATVTSKSLLREHVERARRLGYAEEREEVATGFAGIALPLFDHEGVAFGALSVVAPSYRSDFPRYLTALRDARSQMAAAGALPGALVSAIAEAGSRNR